MAELTPMKRQYNEIKEQHKDCLRKLFLRLFRQNAPVFLIGNRHILFR